MGIVVGSGNQMGDTIDISKAKDNIFGIVILNDWSARDIQGWEYRPLGPFTAKNFATSISPWVITLEALEPFLIPMEIQDPEPLDYLKESKRQTYNIVLETYLSSKNMKEPEKIMESNFSNLYWSMEQMLTHHSITGCNMKPGDLLGTGTISGENAFSRACMLELSWNGTEPLILKDGSSRTFLNNYDCIIMKAYCKNNAYRIGFGQVKTTILPAK